MNYERLHYQTTQSVVVKAARLKKIKMLNFD